MQSIQNTAIVAQIPFVRETIEILLMRVKALMVANNCLSDDVWEIGKLKNKDLHGHILCDPEPLMTDDDVARDDFIPENDDQDSVLEDENESLASIHRPSQSSSAGNSSTSRIF